MIHPAGDTRRFSLMTMRPATFRDAGPDREEERAQAIANDRTAAERSG
jgi:hypothetical protein